uniref:Uncharacterized protein LOC111133666 isoform X7 n=1 Tax=Crassostrea virginica TaxID=6565 RepID=A0A8B8EB99_CRAVI|nr:uncharacterized protein LOC111133666 isoform X7 [Crassostrea virginica]XP_022337928.1 uncharacterized protein LOC111133666 isoform X7 [Crassostrea virginica]XP_022337929.1 uncharacterized protein LOC111133666 isoform X7 [Crassostrea virginica]
MSYSIDLWPLSRYMQQSTYRHDFVPTNGISPRNRQTNYPYGADAPKADIPGPYTNFRPRFADPLPQHIRDLDGQRFDDQPLTERQRVKRGEEWIGGRRYDEPLTDRGVYEPRRPQYYDRDRGRDVSPYRRDDRIYNVLDDGRRTSLDRPINRDSENDLERQNLRLGRHTSLDRYDLMDKRKTNLKQYMEGRRRDPFEGMFQERARNGSPERYYDRGRANERGRDYDRGRNESPTKFREYDRDRNAYNGYNDRYEKPMQPMIDSYADRRMTDRTTYKDYGEFLQEKIKLDELKKQPVEYPAANLRDHLTHRDTYREQMHGPEPPSKSYNSREGMLERERQLEAQIRREMQKIELHDGNFKPWARDAKNPTHHVPKSTNSGVYLFIRTNKLAKADVVKALQEGRSVLANSYGQLKGVATNREIQLLEGNEGWNTRASMTRTGDFWLDRSQDSTEIDDMILVIWFPTFNDAEKWVISERKFKTPSFPESYGSDVMILPLNDSQPQERIAYTYLMTEYPRQLDPVMFREVFVPKIKEVLLRKFGIDGFFIQSVGAKVIRGHWIKPSSLVTCIRFNTRKEALDLFLDPEYKQIRQEIHRRIEQLPFHVNWFKPVSFLFTLDKYV